MAVNLTGLLSRVRPRRLTQAEISERDAERRAMEHMRQQESKLRTEANSYAQVIAAKLEGLNICYRYKRNEKDFMESRIKRISFKHPFVLREETIYLAVDLRPGTG